MNLSQKCLLSIVISTLIGISLDCLAQGQTITDISGSVLSTRKYIELNGSPYLTDVWSKGWVKFSNGKVIKDISLKYDEVADELSFAGKNDEEYFFNDKVTEFTLVYVQENIEYTKHFKNGFPLIKNFTDKSFYEVLIDGPVTLLKKNAKDITQVKEFNSATIVKTVNNNIGYYLVKSGKIIQLKKLDSKNLAFSLDSNKSDLITEFVRNNNLNPKKEEDLKKIIQHYSTIQ